jgi:hypothetical protein
MARLGALYAAQTGDWSQCVDVDSNTTSTTTTHTHTHTHTNTNGNTTTAATSRRADTNTITENTNTDSTSTFCACVFETCGNGVWARDANDGHGDVAGREEEEEAWEYVKACERYCHAGTCV